MQIVTLEYRCFDLIQKVTFSTDVHISINKAQ